MNDKWLIVFKGMPGSGKSTLARALSRELGWPLIDKDDIKDIIDGKAHDPGRLAYDAMFNVAHRQLRLGLSVICDSPLTFSGLYQQARAIATDTDAWLATIECHCSNEQVWRERINSRKALNLPAHHQTDWDALQEYRRAVTDQTAYQISDPRLVLDTIAPLDELISRVAAWLGSLLNRAKRRKPPTNRGPSGASQEQPKGCLPPRCPMLRSYCPWASPPSSCTALEVI